MTASSTKRLLKLCLLNVQHHLLLFSLGATPLPDQQHPSYISAGLLFKLLVSCLIATHIESINDNTQQEVSWLHHAVLLTMQGNRRRHRLKADPFLANRIRHVWDGSNFHRPSDTDTGSEESDSDGASSASEGSSNMSNSSGPDARDGSDLRGFIVDDIEEPVGPEVTATASRDAAEPLEQDEHAHAASIALQDAGFRTHQSVRDCFENYVEYMVYDLVDKTFAVRVRGDSFLHRQYLEATRKIEERLSDRR